MTVRIYFSKDRAKTTKKGIWGTCLNFMKWLGYILKDRWVSKLWNNTLKREKKVTRHVGEVKCVV